MFAENFGRTLPVGRLGLIIDDTCKELGDKIDQQLIAWREKRAGENAPYPVMKDYLRDSYIIKSKLSRFGTGEGWATLGDSVRGDDIYILTDVCNSSLSYNIAGRQSYMSPDEHYQDLLRLISCASAKARRINVIMPYLYEGRRDTLEGRSSLDCALMLHQLYDMGVSNIITFDAHDARVQNAIPFGGFETIQPVYQFVKTLLSNETDLQIDSDHLMVIAPDEGAMGRAVYMANNLGVDMGMFYKRRDYSRYIGDRHPIVAQEFLGSDVKGKDLLLLDDMISSGDLMIDVAREMKRRGARKIFMCATFGMFTNGLKKFDYAYEQGLFDRILTTNLVYQSPALLSKEYYHNVDMSKYIAFVIEHLNHDASISDLLVPAKRIQKAIADYRKGRDIED